MTSSISEPKSLAGDLDDPNDQDHVASLVDCQDRILLEALQQFILPHAGEVVGQTRRQASIMGPEAVKLVAALKEYISSVMKGSEQPAGTTIEVSLDDDSQKLADSNVVPGDVKDRLEATIPSNILEEPSGMDLDSPGITENKKAQPEPPFHAYVLRELRDHVFNKMPIRLLHFVPQGSHLRISLIEKPVIFTYLASIMEKHMAESNYEPSLTGEDWGQRMETYEEAANRLIDTHAGYAILSHTWLQELHGEVTYADWTRGLLDQDSAGYQKLVNFFKVAFKDHKLTLGWMDTICINKESSSELDESIRSMYNWYKGAKVCIVYLADTQTISNVHRDRWFTRGWTLQELLAPNHIKFYSRDWKCMIRNVSSNDKKDLGSEEMRAQILKATTITRQELNHIYWAPLSRRMQLAASRKVTREEDTAYSLMGIFDVSISTAYGEGAKRAFSRLLQAILDSTLWGVLDLLNWAGPDFKLTCHASNVLPSSPANYAFRSSNLSLQFGHFNPLEPITLTHMGLHIPVVLMPGILVKHQEIQHKPIGHYGAQAIVTLRTLAATEFTNGTLLLLDNRAYHEANNQVSYKAAVFSLDQDAGGIYIPKTCIAKLLHCNENAGQATSNMKHNFVLETEKPVVFDMEYSGPNTRYDDDNRFWIAEDELAAHGMQFISLYL